MTKPVKRIKTPIILSKIAWALLGSSTFFSKLNVLYSLKYFGYINLPIPNKIKPIAVQSILSPTKFYYYSLITIVLIGKSCKACFFLVNSISK